MTELEQLELAKATIDKLQKEAHEVYDEFVAKVDITGIEDDVFDYMFNNTRYVLHDIKKKLSS
jgi:hypothetical protein